MTIMEVRQRAMRRLESLSPARLQVADDFLAYLQERESNEATEELLRIPGPEKRIAAGRSQPMAIEGLLKQKREDILRVAAQHGARNVRIFGSAARGDAGPGSDIDVLVDMDQGRSLLDLGGLWRGLNELLGMKVDVVTEKGLRHRIRERVLKEAIPL